jgi:hypothetical protein
VTVITIILPRPGTAKQAAALAHVVNPRVGQTDGGCREPAPTCLPSSSRENGDVEPAARGFGERVAAVELA